MADFEIRQVSWDGGKTWVKPYRFKDTSDVDENGYKFVENFHKSEEELYRLAIKLSEDDMIIKTELNGVLFDDILYNKDNYRSVWIHINSVNYDEYADYEIFYNMLNKVKNVL